jgi:hypothetical protein
MNHAATQVTIRPEAARKRDNTRGRGVPRNVPGKYRFRCAQRRIA